MVQDLVQLCLESLSLSPTGPCFDDDAYGRIQQRFARMQQGPELAHATRELMTLSYFLAKNKNAQRASEQLVTLAATSVPLMRRNGSGTSKDANAAARTKYTGGKDRAPAQLNASERAMGMLDLLITLAREEP